MAMDEDTIKLLARLDERSQATADDISEIKESIKIINSLPCEKHETQISTLFKIVFILLTIALGQSLALVYQMIKG